MIVWQTIQDIFMEIDVAYFGFFKVILLDLLIIHALY